MSRLLSKRTWQYVIKNYMCSSPSATLNKLRPTDFQKKILVWTKKYKTKEEIPEFISLPFIDKAKSELRIKVANILIALTALASLGAVIAGKRAAKRGETVHQKNLDWHKEYNENYEKKENATSK